MADLSRTRFPPDGSWSGVMWVPLLSQSVGQTACAGTTDCGVAVPSAAQATWAGGNLSLVVAGATLTAGCVAQPYTATFANVAEVMNQDFLFLGTMTLNGNAMPVYRPFPHLFFFHVHQLIFSRWAAVFTLILPPM